jgi:hypothetical protein
MPVCSDALQILPWDDILRVTGECTGGAPEPAASQGFRGIECFLHPAPLECHALALPQQPSTRSYYDVYGCLQSEQKWQAFTISRYARKSENEIFRDPANPAGRFAAEHAELV